MIALSIARAADLLRLVAAGARCSAQEWRAGASAWRCESGVPLRGLGLDNSMRNETGCICWLKLGVNSVADGHGRG